MSRACRRARPPLSTPRFADGSFGRKGAAPCELPSPRAPSPLALLCSSRPRPRPRPRRCCAAPGGCAPWAEAAARAGLDPASGAVLADLCQADSTVCSEAGALESLDMSGAWGGPSRRSPITSQGEGGASLGGAPLWAVTAAPGRPLRAPTTSAPGPLGASALTGRPPARRRVALTPRAPPARPPPPLCCRVEPHLRPGIPALGQLLLPGLHLPGRQPGGHGGRGRADGAPRGLERSQAAGAGPVVHRGRGGAGGRGVLAGGGELPGQDPGRGGTGRAGTGREGEGSQSYGTAVSSRRGGCSSLGLP